MESLQTNSCKAQPKPEAVILTLRASLMQRGVQLTQWTELYMKVRISHTQFMFFLHTLLSSLSSFLAANSLLDNCHQILDPTTQAIHYLWVTLPSKQSLKGQCYQRASFGNSTETRAQTYTIFIYSSFWLLSPGTLRAAWAWTAYCLSISLSLSTNSRNVGRNCGSLRWTNHILAKYIHRYIQTKEIEKKDALILQSKCLKISQWDKFGGHFLFLEPSGNILYVYM